MTDFVHLHNHTDYSLLDGAAPISKLVGKAAEMGMKHMAITDHGNMFGAIEFYNACKKAGITAIIGSEFYVASESRHIKSGSEAGNRYQHLILLAENFTGYKNLMKLSSFGFTEGFYYKPRIDSELLEKYHDGLICLSACLGGEIPSLLFADQYEKAKERALYYLNLFGEDHYYLELQDHGLEEQKKVNPLMLQLSKDTGIPLVASNDIHFIDQEDANAQDILICIGTNRKKNEEGRMRFKSDQFYLKSGDEMAELFPYAPEAISNTVKIAEMCDVKLDHRKWELPEFDLPEGFHHVDEYLTHLTYEGLKTRYGTITDAMRERVEYELGVITSMEFSNYFLVVWDFIHWAKEHDIPVGPGRGSGAGSIVAYSLTITDIDPLQFDLLFERFLNPERISMPDFDIDFCFVRRQEVIDYVTEKYGTERVGQIITFGTLKTKAVVKDVARVLDIPFAESNEISKLIPNDPKMTLAKAFAMEPKLAEMEARGELYQELFEVSRKLEGLHRHSSTHAAGVVIGRQILTDYVPLYRDAKTEAITTQYSMEHLENYGLVKMDFLGLKTLTQIENAAKLIRKRIPEFSVDDIEDGDPATYAMLSAGKSSSIFQFESSGMQGMLKRAKPNSIEDLIALNALYRPGPMENIDSFIDGKNGVIEIDYYHPDLEETLKPTYGVIVYQEQVMKVGQIIGGFSLGKADIMRRAMGKKKVSEMEKLRIEFIEGAEKHGYSQEFAASMFKDLEPFAGYGFNKSHAAAYSVVAYHTAYLKANFPVEFMAATLTNEINNTDKLAQYIKEAQTIGLEVLPPNINLSSDVFGVADGNLVYGLNAIKNVGSGAVQNIITEREANGPYTDMFDFLHRVDLRQANRKTIESLIKAGAFDELENNRATLLFNLEKLIEYATNRKAAQQFGQVSLFDAEEEDALGNFELAECEAMDGTMKLELERELLGFYFSGHPLDDYRKIWERSVRIDLNHPERIQIGKTCNMLGIVTDMRTIITKKGDPMAFIRVEDFTGTIEMIIFPKVWMLYKGTVVKDAVLGFTGKFDNKRSETPQFLVDTVVTPDELTPEGISRIHVQLKKQFIAKKELTHLREYFYDHSGNCDVVLYVHDEPSGKDVRILASNRIKLSYSDALIEGIKDNPMYREVWFT